MARVVFCQRVVYSYFGVMTISAVLKKAGHQCELVMESSPLKVIEEILFIKPDMVMFSTLTATGDFEWAVDIAQALKIQRPKILMVFGSTHPTLFPEETMEHPAVDILCRGEGELAALELCNRYDRDEDYSKITSLWVRTPKGIIKNPLRGLVEDLDQFPFPDREIYQKYGYYNQRDSFDVLAGRGCIFDCSYCMNTTFKEIMRGKGNFVRKHSSSYLIAQLQEIKTKYNPISITFMDELFTTNKRWVKEFCEKYRQYIRLPFICSATAETIDEEIASYLKEAGVFRVCIGLESGNETLRNRLLNKRFSNEQFIKATGVLHKYKIKFLTANMIGFPTETVENAFETVRLNQRVKADFLYSSVFQPYPELPITKDLQEQGKLARIKPSEYPTTFFQGSLILQDNINELVNLHKFFFIAVKFPWMNSCIKSLIKLPPNWLYEQIFILSYGWMQWRCFKRNPLQFLGNFKIFYAKKNKLLLKDVPRTSPNSTGTP